MHPLDPMEIFDEYCRRFTDTALWSPYVELVCQRHQLTPCEPVRTGLPGTYPAFIVGDRWVIKFFGRLFEGGQAYQVEKEANRLTMIDPAIRTAQVAASGALGGEGWPWPYLVFDYIPAVSLGNQIEQVSTAGLLEIAVEMGETARRLHALPLDGSPVFPNDHNTYQAFLIKQRAACTAKQREWGTLAPHLLEQIEDFLPPLDELIDRSRHPHLIHADLTRDHLLGRAADGHWSTLALIDFGDAMTGALLYELSALHLDLFAGSRQMLAAFLDTYGIDTTFRAELPRKAMATALLHRFNVLACLPPEMLRADSLDELAHMIWEAV
jgi:hygromycin-B 7''-O-kinase